MKQFLNYYNRVGIKNTGIKRITILLQFFFFIGLYVWILKTYIPHDFFMDSEFSDYKTWIKESYEVDTLTNLRYLLIGFYVFIFTFLIPIILKLVYDLFFHVGLRKKYSFIFTFSLIVLTTIFFWYVLWVYFKWEPYDFIERKFLLVYKNGEVSGEDSHYSNYSSHFLYDLSKFIYSFITSVTTVFLLYVSKKWITDGFKSEDIK